MPNQEKMTKILRKVNNIYVAPSSFCQNNVMSRALSPLPNVCLKKRRL